MRKILCLLSFTFSLSFWQCSPAVKFDGQSPTFGKPRAPVTLTYTSYKWLSIGEQATINYSGSPQTDAEDLVVSVSLPNGLNFVAGDTSVSSGGPLTAGNAIEGAVIVQANAEGMYYISLAGQIRYAGRAETNNIAIPVQYGTADPELKNVGTITTSTIPGSKSTGSQKTQQVKIYHEIQADEN